MKYKEALEVVKKYQYLLNKEIIHNSGIKSRIDYITILPDEGIKLYNNDWFHPMDVVFARFLADKNCETIFIIDFTKANNSGIFLTEKNLLESYSFPPSSNS